MKIPSSVDSAHGRFFTSYLLLSSPLCPPSLQTKGKEMKEAKEDKEKITEYSKPRGP
jgi:hypothetical protein